MHFTVECHGEIPRGTDVHTTYVSSHWVRSCLEVQLVCDLYFQALLLGFVCVALFGHKS